MRLWALSRACRTFEYHQNPQEGLLLWERNIDAQAGSLWANGYFYFYKALKGEPQLNILANLRLDAAAAAQRYFLEPLMLTRLVDYLTGALNNDQIENGTFVFSGNPNRFPFKHNHGQFEVWMPMKQAEYHFEPGCLVLTQLDIDLDFLKDGLFMHTQQSGLSEVLRSQYRRQYSLLFQRNIVNRCRHQQRRQRHPRLFSPDAA